MAFPPAPPHPVAVAKNPDLRNSVDDRVSLDKDSQWIFEDGDTEYVYNFILEQWVGTERFNGDENGDEGEKTEENGPDSSKKRQNTATLDREEEQNKQTIKRIKKEKIQAMKDEISRLKKQKAQAGDTPGEKQSKGVYISALPSDITQKELAETFSKYGVIALDLQSEPRVKLYHDENGNFKNEALVMYHAKESAQMAVEMLDDSFIRPPSSGLQKIKVQIALFDSEKTASSEKEKRVYTHEEKQLMSRRNELMRQKITSWEDDEEAVSSNDKTSQLRSRIWSKTVVVELMYRREELAGDPMLELDLKEDIQDECNKHGIGADITKITIFDKSDVVTIKFNNSDSTKKCIDVFHGRFFDGLKLNAYTYNGEKFEKSKTNVDEEDEKERLDSFGHG